MNDRFSNVIKKVIPLVILAILVLFYIKLQNINKANNLNLTDEEVVEVINNNVESVLGGEFADSLEGFDIEDIKINLEDEAVLDKEVPTKENVSDQDEIEEEPTKAAAIDEDGYYYDYENVILYLDTYGRLPKNYITKTKAKKLGWEGGSVEDYYPGGAIGGGRFGNNEGLLPTDDGIEYFECDIDTNGQSKRGAKRVIFSNEPKYYYTTDHYETFTRYEVIDGRVVEAD